MIYVCIPTYYQRGQGAHLFEQLLNSLAKQINTEYSLAISDNDDSGVIAAVLDRWTKKNRNVPIGYKRNKIKGASENINAVLDMIPAGEKVKLMMMDDMFNALDCLQLFSQALDSHKWVISDSISINAYGGRTGKRIARYDPNNFDTNTIGMPSVIGFIQSDLRFDERLKTFCDLYFYYQLYQRYGMPGKVNGFTVMQRYHGASQSRNQPPTHKEDKHLLLSEGKLKLFI